MKVETQAVASSEKYLRILITVEIGGAQHVHSVLVPWGWLIEPEMIAHLDRAARRALIEKWSDVPLEAPLF